MGTLSKSYIAVIDDESSLCTLLSRLLRLANLQPITYSSAEAFPADDKHPQFACSRSKARRGKL